MVTIKRLVSRPIRVAALAGLVLLTISGCAAFSESLREERLNSIGPNPSLSPEEVVRIQMTAIEYNDATNAGIELAYRFASPTNRSAVGSVNRFARMLSSPAYRPMFSPKSVLYDEAIVSGDSATVKIYLTSPNDYIIVYIFTLSSQPGSPCSGCWMTDAVQIDSVQRVQKFNAI